MFLKFGEVPVAVVSSREAANEVMKTHDAVLSSRPQTSTVKAIINRRGTGIVLAPCGGHWRQLRKICMVELLCAKRVQSFRAIREEEVTRLIQAVSFSASASASASTSTSRAAWHVMNLTKLLVMYANAMHRAQSEVRAAFMGQAKVTEDGLTKLSYLQWVMKETLRLHTPGPILLPRESLEACRIMGYDVPKGTVVIVNAWAISRDPEYWDQPEVFKPERFENDKMDFKGHDFEFMPFGAGRRIFPGISFAVTTVHLALANLLFHFDWKLPKGILASELDMEETMGLTAKKKTDLWLKPILRVPFVSVNN